MRELKAKTKPMDCLMIQVEYSLYEDSRQLYLARVEELTEFILHKLIPDLNEQGSGNFTLVVVGASLYKKAQTPRTIIDDLMAKAEKMDILYVSIEKPAMGISNFYHNFFVASASQFLFTLVINLEVPHNWKEFHTSFQRWKRLVSKELKRKINEEISKRKTKIFKGNSFCLTVRKPHQGKKQLP
jgi:hypothetical protein